MMNHGTTLKTLRLTPKTIEYLSRKSRELKVSQGTLVTYAFNKMTDEDYRILRLGKELVGV